MPNQSGKIVLILVLLLLIAGATAYFFLPSFKKQEYSEKILANSPSPLVVSDESSISSEEMKDYYSKTLKINFKAPKEAQIEEKFTDILIGLPPGDIQIRRIGTNFTNIKDYFENLKEKNKLNLLTEELKKVNTLDSMLITMKNPKIQAAIVKEYSIYINNWVFKFSTSNESLYPVLDQIVESFEYRP